MGRSWRLGPVNELKRASGMDKKIEAAFRMGRDYFDYVSRDMETARTWGFLKDGDQIPLGEFQTLRAKYEWCGRDMRRAWRSGFNAGIGTFSRDPA
jgi:hypothetical protein